jgi:hypothetical protein
MYENFVKSVQRQVELCHADTLDEANFANAPRTVFFSVSSYRAENGLSNGKPVLALVLNVRRPCPISSES